MSIDLRWATAPLRLLLCAAALVILSGNAPTSAQEKDAGKAADNQPAEETDDETQPAEESEQAEAEEKDPFAVPENATAAELWEFITTVKRNRGRTLESVTKSAKAAVAASQAIRDIEGVDSGDEIKAIREQLSALSFLQRFDPDSKKELKSLLEGLKNDERPEISQIAAAEDFKLRIDSARSASKEKQQEIVAELKELIGDDFDRQDYSLASNLARSIGASENVDVAASLYEDMAAMMSQSEDEMLKSRAPKMLGAARRIRLPGNFMQIMGTTTTGENFDWDAYRGKVVLVDFWASWCGPCRAEIPNMKKNLEAYSDRGFEIVGVNLDQTLDACEKYVAKEDLTWTNLISDKEGELGWDNPLATYYGITGIPTAILVDQDGKVVSLKARGKELDRLLEEILGEPSAPEDADEAGEDADGAGEDADEAGEDADADAEDSDAPSDNEQDPDGDA